MDGRGVKEVTDGVLDREGYTAGGCQQLSVALAPCGVGIL